MSVSQYIGNGIGMLYAVATDGTTIVSSNPNTPKGVRDMRMLGSVSAPIAALRSAVGTITFTATPAGNVTAVTIGGVNQIGANVAMTAGDPTASALSVAQAIASYTPPSGDDYTAISIGAVVYIYSTPSGGEASNGLTITVSVSTVTITSTTTDFSGGSDETGVYDSVVGLRFFINATLGASRVTLTGASEITKDIVVRGMQTGIVTKSLSVASNRLLGIDRSCAFTQIYVDTESSAATDDLEYIEVEGFVEGDSIILAQYNTTRIVTLVDNTLSSITGNIILTDEVPFQCDANKSIELRLRFIGSQYYWVESGRSISGGAVSLRRVDMLALISSGGVQQGQSYLINDVGQAGIIVSGIDTNSISSRGDYIGYFPDYQNVSTDYGGMWYPSMALPTLGDLYATGGLMYESVTGLVGSDPSTDTVNWTLVATSDPRYQKAVLSVQYDVNYNVVTQGSDSNGNIVIGSTGFATFKWGSLTCTGNLLVDSFMNFNIVPGVISGNTFYNCTLNVAEAVYVTALGYNSLNLTTLFSSITSTGGMVSMSNNIGTYASIELSIGATDVTISNNLWNASEKSFLLTGLGFTITDCVIGSWASGVPQGQWYLSTYTLRASNIAFPYLTIDQNESQLIVNSAISNHIRTVDLDGSSWAANVLTISSQYLSCGTLRCTATTTKTISSIAYGTTAFNTRPLALQGANTVSVTITPTAIGVAAANNIVSDAGSITLVGRTNGADIYVVQRDGNLWKKLYATQYV